MFQLAAIITATCARAVDGKFLSSLKLNFRGAAATLAAVTAFQFPVLQPTLHPPSAEAAVNQLADVGLKEFLVKDGRQWLRLAIPIGNEMKLGSKGDGDEIKLAQESLELVRLRLEQVGFSNKAVWGGGIKDANVADSLVRKNRVALISAAGAKGDEATSIIDTKLLPTITALVDSLRKQDITTTNTLQETAGGLLADLRLLQLPSKVLPYKIPEEYNSLPRLAGRAEVELVIKSAGKGFRLEDGKTVVQTVPFRLVLDGYHAPLTAGNFVDLVNKKWYDGMPLQKVEQLTVQTGKPVGGEGYTDPKTKELRTIPLELFYKKDSEPTYGITSDDDNRATDAMTLPFQAYGAVGMARGNEDADSASSQFFLLKWDQGLIAPGRNTLDGFYSVFGYTTQNEQLLSQVTDKDIVVSAKVISGLENLITP